MRILVAPDKFKHSLGAFEVAESIAAGLGESLPSAEIRLLPLADGGEGTAEAIHRAIGGTWRQCRVHDAKGDVVSARYLLAVSPPGKTVAIMEMSEAAGLARLQGAVVDVDLASTFGVGEMLLDALEHGAEEIVVGLGGSATNDGGFGLARALGFRFFDEADAEITEAVSHLQRLARIEAGPAREWIVQGAADVRSPLLGERGATYTFGRQKGASAMQLPMIEEALSRLAEICARKFRSRNHERDGAGAAGGLGFGLMTFCAAPVSSGFDLVSKFTGLEAAVKWADLVITGEGSLDLQTREGKVPEGVSALARGHGKKVFAVAGCATGDPQVRGMFDGVYVLAKASITREESMARAAALLREAGQELGAMLAAQDC